MELAATLYLLAPLSTIKGLNVCGVIHTDVLFLFTINSSHNYLEDTGDLDVDSVVDLFCLHFVYQPKINEALKSFMDDHEHNMTPVQLFARGVLVHNVDLADPVDDGTFSIGNLESPAVTVPVINILVSPPEVCAQVSHLLDCNIRYSYLTFPVTEMKFFQKPKPVFLSLCFQQCIRQDEFFTYQGPGIWGWLWKCLTLFFLYM